ncbi:MAG TPA: epoxyqueuosine reductase QueH [Candidatus Omnitrophota bacterium]|nr:epoxyqueuosine reductase QueH [Candidatus Omnitrophota bacterium]
MMKNSSFLQLPEGEIKILLHVCCAPCSGSILKRLVENGMEPTVFFYNPNIYPAEEYRRRKEEVIRYAEKIKVPFVDEDPDPEQWMKTVQGYENAPERGERCTLCFEMRLGKTAAYASKNGFRVFATSLGISRWKDLLQVNRAGEKAARFFSQLIYWDYNWRLHGGTELMASVSQEENFYKQKYCGCLYSLHQSISRSLSKKAGVQPAR